MERIDKIKRALAECSKEEFFDQILLEDLRWTVKEIERLQSLIKEAIDVVCYYEHTETAQGLHETLEECQTVLYKSGLAAKRLYCHVEPAAATAAKEESDDQARIP